MSLLDEVKTALRIKSVSFDETEIVPIIEACKADLLISGITKTDESDFLIRRAVALYAKGSFGYSDDSEKYMKAYEALKISMSLAGDYNAVF